MDFVRDNPTRKRFGVGKTKWNADVRPRLEAKQGKIILGPRSFAWRSDIVDEVMQDFIRESVGETLDPPPNPYRRRRAEAESAKPEQTPRRPRRRVGG